MTLEIPTELKAQIERAARERGLDAHSFVVEATRRALAQIEESGQAAKRRALALELRGSVSGGSPTLDEFLRERSEEARLEAQRDEALWSSGSGTSS